MKIKLRKLKKKTYIIEFEKVSKKVSRIYSSLLRKIFLECSISSGIYGVKFKNIDNEFINMRYVYEDTTQIILNLKKICFNLDYISKLNIRVNNNIIVSNMFIIKKICKIDGDVCILNSYKNIELKIHIKNGKMKSRKKIIMIESNNSNILRINYKIIKKSSYNIIKFFIKINNSSSIKRIVGKVCKMLENMTKFKSSMSVFNNFRRNSLNHSDLIDQYFYEA